MLDKNTEWFCVPKAVFAMAHFAALPVALRDDPQLGVDGILERMRGDVTPDEVRSLYIQNTPLGRLETPDDIAGVVLFLASPAADFITGEAINVNGGSWMD